MKSRHGNWMCLTLTSGQNSVYRMVCACHSPVYHYTTFTLSLPSDYLFITYSLPIHRATYHLCHLWLSFGFRELVSLYEEESALALGVLEVDEYSLKERLDRPL